MRIRSLVLAASLLLVGVVPSFAQLGVGPRALGMGGAFTAIAAGPSGPYWNPAGLARVKGFHLQLASVQAMIGSELDWQDVAENPPTSDEERRRLLDQLNTGTTDVDVSAHTGFVLPNFGFSLVPQVSASLDATQYDLDSATGEPRVVIGADGTATVPSRATILGTGIGSAMVSFARALTENSSVGVNLKYMAGTHFVQEVTHHAVYAGGDPQDPHSYDVVDDSPDAVETDKSGVGLDVGYLHEVLPGTTVGAMFRNVVAPDLPGGLDNRSLSVGVAQKLWDGRVTAAVDIANVLNGPDLNLGISLRPIGLLSLSAGLYQGKPTFGAGLNLLGVMVQAAYSPKNSSLASVAVYF